MRLNDTIYLLKLSCQFSPREYFSVRRKEARENCIYLSCGREDLFPLGAYLGRFTCGVVVPILAMLKQKWGTRGGLCKKHYSFIIDCFLSSVASMFISIICRGSLWLHLRGSCHLAG